MVEAGSFVVAVLLSGSVQVWVLLRGDEITCLGSSGVIEARASAVAVKVAVEMGGRRWKWNCGMASKGWSQWSG